MLDTTICKQTQTMEARHDPSYKQGEVKTNPTSFLCGNRNKHYNMDHHKCSTKLRLNTSLNCDFQYVFQVQIEVGIESIRDH